MLTYKIIDLNYYNNNVHILTELINDIWCNPEDSKKAITAILNSLDTQWNSFHYTIEINNEVIWITWFYTLENRTYNVHKTML